MGPDLLSLALLVASVAEGSVSRAAAVHGLSQPAASARLSLLERRLGVTLLERGPSGSRPTAAGTLVTGWSADLLRAVETFESAARGLRRDVDSTLRVAASYTVAEYLLPRWLAELARRHPDVSSELEVANSTEVTEAVLAERVDLGFVEGTKVDPRLAAVEVGTDALVVVVAPTHHWATRRSPLTAAQLASARLVTREAGSGTREAFEDLLAPYRTGRPPTPLLTLGSTAAVRATVVNGSGPAALSRLCVADDLERGRLVAVPITGVELGRSLKAVWRRDARPAGAAAALLSFATTG